MHAVRQVYAVTQGKFCNANGKLCGRRLIPNAEYHLFTTQHAIEHRGLGIVAPHGDSDVRTCPCSQTGADSAVRREDRHLIARSGHEAAVDGHIRRDTDYGINSS